MTAPVALPQRTLLTDEPYIVGLAVSDEGLRAISRMVPGDVLVGRRQPKNAHDRWAISLHASDGVLVGWVPLAERRILAALMDAGRQIEYRITQITTRNSHPSVRLDVSLIWPETAAGVTQ